MALNPLNSSNLEQLALNGLTELQQQMLCSVAKLGGGLEFQPHLFLLYNTVILEKLKDLSSAEPKCTKILRFQFVKLKGYVAICPACYYE